MKIIRRIGTVVASLIIGVIMTVGTAVPASAATAAPTKGAIELATPGYGRVHLVGWAFDPARSGQPSSLDVVIDGKMAALPFADRARPDVDRVQRITGNHGFYLYIPTTLGTHRVCIVARPVADSGSTWSILGCRTLTVSHR